MRFHVNFRDLNRQAASAGDQTTNGAHKKNGALKKASKKQENAKKGGPNTTPDATAFSREAEKLRRHLTDFKADLVDVWGSIEKLPRSGGYAAHLRLHLPTGTITANGRAYTKISAWTAVTDEMIVRIEKHKARLADTRVRRRRRDADIRRRSLGEAPSLPPDIARAAAEETRRQSVQSELAAAYPALLRFLTNEVLRHESNGNLVPQTVDPVDLLDETAVVVLERSGRKPADLAFDHWFFKVAHERVLDQITRARERRPDPGPSLDSVIERIEGPEGFTEEEDLVRELIGPNPRPRFGYDIPQQPRSDDAYPTA